MPAGWSRPGAPRTACVYVIADETVCGPFARGLGRKCDRAVAKTAGGRAGGRGQPGRRHGERVIREADATVPVIAVRATRGKWLRAEPVAALYEQGKVKHAGVFPALEDEMCDFGLDGLSSGRSPDRLDAMVWAITALAFKPRGEPRIRML